MYSSPQVSDVLSFIYLIMFIAIAFTSVFSLVIYLLKAIGLMGIAKGRGIENPWLSFIPVADSYLFGKVADDINIKTSNKKTSNRIIMSIAAAFTVFLSIITLIFLIIKLPNFISLIEYSIYDNYLNESLFANQLFNIVIPIYAIAAITSLASLVLVIFNCISMYSLSKAYKPSTSVLFIVLYIFFGDLILAIAFMTLRNKAPIPSSPQNYNYNQYQYNNQQNPQNNQYNNSYNNQYNAPPQQPNPYQQPQQPSSNNAANHNSDNQDNQQ